MGVQTNYFLILMVAVFLFRPEGVFAQGPAILVAGDGSNKTEQYLRQFGYYGDDVVNHQVASLMNTDPQAALAEAIRDFQSMADLPITGVMDDATRRMMAMPRCGMSDRTNVGNIVRRRRKRYAVQGSKWPRNLLTYRISTYTSDVSTSVTNREIARAFSAWSAVTPLRFVQRFSGSVDIEIKFAARSHGDAYPFDGRSGTLAHAFYPQYGGDVHMDDDEVFSANSYSGTNMFQVFAHEVGHSLGLGHSAINAALMAPFYRGYIPNFQLHSDDIQGIQIIYGRNTAATTRATKPTPRQTTRTTPTARITTRRTTRTTSRITTTTRSTTTTSPPSRTPTLGCADAQTDVVVRWDGNTYIFRGSQYALIDAQGMAPGFPKAINSDWDGLPDNIDAALYWDSYYGPRTYIFKGALYWRFEKTGLRAGYPKLIALGWPGLPSNLDAAFVWSGNGRTYFIKGDQYYWYSLSSGSVPSGYPKPLRIWAGLPSKIDAAFQYENDRTYFFSGTEYYRFNDRTFSVDSGYPRSIASWWLGCRDSERLEMDEDDQQFIAASCTTCKSSMMMNMLVLVGLYYLSPYW